MTIKIITIGFLFLNISCGQRNKSNIDSIIKTDNYKVGDCFEFKEKIKDFGVVLLEEKSYPDGKQFDLFPVKLDTTKLGTDRFKFGQTYLSKFPDFTKSSGITEGFMVYSFLNEINFEHINRLFTHVGSISIKSEYQNKTGGTAAANVDEFRFQLNRWDKMFGRNGRLVKLSEVLE